MKELKKSTFGVIVGTRGFFSGDLAKDGRNSVLDKITENGFSYVALTEADTKSGGCVETREDARKCAELFRRNADKIDGIIISLPNFGDEVAATESVRFSTLDVPVLVHAFDDELDHMDLAHRRDAFCGKLSVCNNLRQYGIKFSDTTYHTTSVNSRVFVDDLVRFDQTCRVYRGLKGARIAQIGTRPGAFKTVRYSEKLFERSGITIVPVDFSEIIFHAEKITDQKRIDRCLEEINAYAKPVDEGFHCDVSAGLRQSAKLTLAIEDWMHANECVAGAIQCWDSLELNYHCAPCLTMSMLGERGIPFSCEADVSGAVAMYALDLANGSPAGYLDWNNSYGEDRNKCICFHCSNFPKSFFGMQPDIGCLDVLGGSLGHENCFGTLKGQVQAGGFTFANIETNDFDGTVDMYTGEGEFLNEPVHTVGSPAVCKIDNLQVLLKHLRDNGFHHHIAMSRGQSADVLAEVFGDYFGWNVYRHQ